MPGLVRARSLQIPSEAGGCGLLTDARRNRLAAGADLTPRTGPDARRRGPGEAASGEEAEGSSEGGSARPAARRRGREGLGLEFESRVGGGCGGGARPASPPDASQPQPPGQFDLF